MEAHLNRTGNFTSSSIYLLMSDGKEKGTLGKPALTYIEDKSIELRLGRSLQKETNSKPTSFGKLVEERVFSLLSTEYILCSDLRFYHPLYSRWNGCPDMLSEDKVCDIKVPYNIKIFTQKADIMIANDVQKLKKLYPENYWQLVSNSILTDKPIAELIIYCPYLKELIEIKENLQNYDGDMNDVAWINWAKDEELPYLIEGNYYKNLYKLKWEVSAEDKEFLTNRVKMAIDKIKEGCV
jgi:hypothetical protein